MSYFFFGRWVNNRNLDSSSHKNPAQVIIQQNRNKGGEKAGIPNNRLGRCVTHLTHAVCRPIGFPVDMLYGEVGGSIHEKLDVFD